MAMLKSDRGRSPIEILRSYRAHGYTLRDAVASRAEPNPDRPFVIYDGRTWSWAEIIAAADSTASALAHWGIARGDRVCLMARNSEKHIILLLALSQIGAILVPTNPEYGASEAGYVFKHAAAALVIAEPDTLPVVRDAFTAEALEAGLLMTAGGLDGLAGLDDLLTEQSAAPAPSASTPDDVCLIIYTSGTSGFPKGVMHSQRTVLLAGEVFLERMHLVPEDRLMVVLPMFHINALLYSISGAIAAGAAAVIVRRFSASRFWKTAVETGATEVNVIEAMGNIIANRSREEYDPRHRIVKVYGARAVAAKVFREAFGIQHVVSGYGMTEVPGVISPPFDGAGRPNSIGILGRHPDPAVPAPECRLLDDEHHDVPDGEVGELAVRTPCIMRGYFRDEAQTAQAFHEGWFLTGDLVRRDAEGWYYFVSRKKDIIRKKGNNIAGAELDRQIGQHPSVAEVAAIAVPAELGEDEILAAIVVRPGITATAEEIVAWCAARLEPIKVPRYVLFVDTLPHTATHKVAKNVLRADTTLVTRAFDRLATGSVTVSPQIRVAPEP